MTKQYILTAGEVAALVLLNDSLDDILFRISEDIPAELREETETLQGSLQSLLDRLNDRAQGISA